GDESASANSRPTIAKARIRRRADDPVMVRIVYGFRWPVVSTVSGLPSTPGPTGMRARLPLLAAGWRVPAQRPSGPRAPWRACASEAGSAQHRDARRAEGEQVPASGELTMTNRHPCTTGLSRGGFDLWRRAVAG